MLILYYYPNHIEGTGFVTQELIAPDRSGSIPNRLGTLRISSVYPKLLLKIQKLLGLAYLVKKKDISVIP